MNELYNIFIAAPCHSLLGNIESKNNRPITFILRHQFIKYACLRSQRDTEREREHIWNIENSNTEIHAIRNKWNKDTMKPACEHAAL